MRLQPGTVLGPYEVVAPLGAGGMGEVFRARDARLGRDVAIKALPEAFANDPERLARFEREAKLLASLSHPNVAGIHGLELVEGHRYLVLEFVEGETLAARIERGALPLADAIDVARQVAAGVEAAHEATVVHRDLKPGNVMIKADGSVKVLDFGLAKGGAAHGASGSDPRLSASPTMTYAATGTGVILGTAAYMSPEQARGRAVDRRTDVWSFGCVLYECLTGRQAFQGETVSDMVARILEREPDWSALPASTPAWLRRLLYRCLTKDARQRLQSIGEARIALERGGEGEEPAPATRRPSRFAWLPWAVAAALGVIVAAQALVRPAAEPVRRLQVGFPPGQSGVWTSYPVLSPDGRRVAVVAADSAGAAHVWWRRLDEPDFRELPGTEDALLVYWSPDSRSIAYSQGRSLQRVSLEDGTVQKITDGITAPRGAHWGRNGLILYTPTPNSSIWSVPAEGGAQKQLTQLDTTLLDASHRFPVWLPDGRHFLFSMFSNNPRVLGDIGGIYLGSVDGGEPRRLTKDVGSFLVLGSGHLLVLRNSNLVAIPFDLRSLKVGTSAIPVTDRVAFDPSAGLVRASASEHGDIAWSSTGSRPQTDLAWLERGGHRRDPLGIRAEFEAIRLSPDGSRVAAQMTDATGLVQLWVVDLARRTTSRLTRGLNDSYTPVWSPDGERIAFGNRDAGTEDLYVQLASGTRPKERVWTATTVDVDVTDWSADGRYLFFDGTLRAGGREVQVWVHDLEADSAHAVLAGEFDQYDARLSPDGRWLAYVSEESGRPEVFVRSFPDLERKWQVSTAGGVGAHWRRDGRELLITSGAGSDRVVSSVAVVAGSAGFEIGEPKPMFVLPPDVLAVDPAADHARLLALLQPVSREAPTMRLLTGWRVPAPR